MGCVAIVGNGPLPDGAAESIDSAELVIRFNEPMGEPERIGSRTDILFVMNSGKTMQQRLSDPAFQRGRFFQAATQIVLPYHPSIIARYHPRPNILSRLKGRRADWTEETLAMVRNAGKEAIVLPAAFYEACCEDLGIPKQERGHVFPSSGFLGIRYAMDRYPAPDHRIALFGFSWQGWKRHAWERERAWITQRLATG